VEPSIPITCGSRAGRRRPAPPAPVHPSVEAELKNLASNSRRSDILVCGCVANRAQARRHQPLQHARTHQILARASPERHCLRMTHHQLDSVLTCFTAWLVSQRSPACFTALTGWSALPSCGASVGRSPHAHRWDWKHGRDPSQPFMCQQLAVPDFMALPAGRPQVPAAVASVMNRAAKIVD